MDTTLSRTIATVQLGFWRAAAKLTGIAVRNRSSLHRIVLYTPIALAAVGAYFLGRILAELLLVNLIF
jgi:hypothetical protein